MSTLNQAIGLLIDSAVPEDLDQILAIEHASFSAPWSRKAFETELIGNEFSTILVARPRTGGRKTNEVIGYVCVWIVFEELRFMNLAVSPQARRQGIGKILVTEALKHGLSRDARRALLEVRKSNIAAQALYARFGFKVYGQRRAYYTNPVEDAILMSRGPISLPSKGI